MSSQHTNATASHSDAAATMNNESLRLQLATKAPQSTATYTSGHVPLFWPSLGSLNQLQLHTQELAILGTTHPPPLIAPLPARLRTGILVE